MNKLLAQAFGRAAKLPAGEQDAIAEFVLAELDLRAQTAEASMDATREGEAGAGRVRENLWGNLPPDEPLDR